MGLVLGLGLAIEEYNIFPNSYPPNSLMQILSLREFKNNQPLLTCFMFYHGTGCVQPGAINWPLLCIPKSSRWHTWRFHLICCFNREPLLLFLIILLFSFYLKFEIQISNFQIFFSHRNLWTSGFVDVRRPRIKFDWTSVRLLRCVAAVKRASGGSSAAGLEGWILDKTLRLLVTGDQLTRVTC